MEEEQYDTAQICLSGHIINLAAQEHPEGNKKFCDKCGEITITHCPNCHHGIRGLKYDQNYVDEPYVDLDECSAPAFCIYCGKPYPWTETKIQAAQELAKDSEIMSDEDKRIWSQSIDEIVKDSPAATLAATRLKGILSKVGKPIADTLKDIVVDIVSESVKKVLWP